ncbi:MAG: hypothetical protein Q9213_004039 [Squamulea squamosa]
MKSKSQGNLPISKIDPAQAATSSGLHTQPHPDADDSASGEHSNLRRVATKEATTDLPTTQTTFSGYPIDPQGHVTPGASSIIVTETSISLAVGGTVVVISNSTFPILVPSTPPVVLAMNGESVLGGSAITVNGTRYSREQAATGLVLSAQTVAPTTSARIG